MARSILTFGDLATDKITHDLQRMNPAACVDSAKLSTGADSD